MSFFSHTLFPLFLILATPTFAALYCYLFIETSGSLNELVSLVAENGPVNALVKVWAPIFWGSKPAWTILGIFAGVQLIFMRVLPGKRWEGPLTPKGNTPVYKANGVLAFLTSIGLFCYCAFYAKLFDAAMIYDHFSEIIGALNIFSLCFCLFLLIKGLTFPSSTDCGSTGNPVLDFYWGTELYPRILGWDIKMFTNCRFGMMSWGLLLLSYAAKQYQLYGFVSDSMLVSVALQLVYITKFFYWEAGYLRSIDIMHDRAGYMICWGCLVWVPSVYTSASLYMVRHPIVLGTPLAAAIFLVGTASIMVNYWADAQRQYVRARDGKVKVFGRPAVVIRAKYTTDTGKPGQSLLLASGWWGIARHFHYAPEIFGAFCWSVPALFDSVLPYFYTVFLTILLVHRSIRDDQRCSLKYGKYWDEYRKKVPYKIIPLIY